MKFFKPEDFDDPEEKYISHYMREWNANLANAKLEREGRTVWGIQNLIGNPNQDQPGPEWSTVGYFSFPNHKLAYEAILINIQPLKKECSHPKEKVSMRLAKWQGGLIVGSICKVTGKGLSGEMKTLNEQQWFECECGAKVQPKEFEEI